jgi:hypothetical protein
VGALASGSLQGGLEECAGCLAGGCGCWLEGVLLLLLLLQLP